MTPIYEAEVEDWVIDLLQEQGYSPLSAEEQEAGRDGFSGLLLRRRVQRNGGPLPEFRHQHICHAAVRAVGIRVVFRARLV